MPPTVLHLSTYATNGGAARAASALHRAMLKQGTASAFRMAQGVRFRVASELDRQVWRLQRSPVATWRSPARFGSLSADQINASHADIVNLHWVTDGFLSIEQIGRITKPVVWSMYDMWPFCGTEHYGIDSPDARWRTGYTAANRPADERGWDIDRDAWQRKRSRWRPMHMVPASTWLLEAVSSSALMGDWPVTRVPHVVDDVDFAPRDRAEARHTLGIEHDEPAIVFLASAGVADSRKGFDLLAQALPAVLAVVPTVHLIVVGPVEPERQSIGGVPITWLGPLSGDESLRAAYSSGDAIVVPSREDNMPLTAMEAHTSGRAVVAFRVGGLPDIVEHHVTGYLAEPFDVESLGAGIVEAIEDSRGDRRWAEAARQRALATWSPAAVVPSYLGIYDEVR